MIHSPTHVALLACSAFIATAAAASPPPVPSEMLYPNIAPPSSQFGQYGQNKDQLNEPVGIALSDAGELYVADVNNHMVKVLDRSGRLLRSFGGLGPEEGKFRFPHDVALANGELYVADTGNSRIQVFTPEGRFLRSFGALGRGGGLLNQPIGVTADELGVVVADKGSNRVELFSLAGEYQASSGSAGSADGQFDVPSDVALDPEGNIYVADSYNNRIQKLDRHGRFVKAWGGWGSYSGLMATPSSVSYSSGRVYVADLINHRIQVFDREGKFQFQWGRHPVAAHEGSGRLHYPMAISAAPSGDDVAVCEPFEYRCQIFAQKSFGSVQQVNDKAWWDKGGRFHYGARAKSARTILTIAEPDTHSVLVFDLSGDAPQLITKLGGQGRELGNLVRPSGQVIDPDRGLIYVADGGNHRIQIYELQKNRPNTLSFKANTARVIRAKSMVSMGLPTLSAQGFDGSAASPVEPGCLTDGGDLIYVCDPHNGRVLVVDRDLNLVRVIGSRGTGQGQLLVPSDVATSSDGKTVYVVDTYNFRVNAYEPSGKFLYSWGGPGPRPGEFIHPFSIASDRKGSLYISDDAANRIQKFDEKGKFIKTWGRWGTEPGQFYKPKGLTVDDKGRIIIADFGNHRAQIMDKDGNFIQMFGIGEGYTLPLSVASAKPLFSATSGTRELSNGGRYLLTFEPGTKPVALNEEFGLKLKIIPAAQGATAPSALRVTATMPAHYHGMTREPVVTALDDGTWQVAGMLLHMPGHWQINFDIGEGNQTERAQLDVTVN